MKKRPGYEPVILSVLLIAIAAVFLQMHRYFTVENTVYFKAGDTSPDSAAMLFDTTVMKHIGDIVENPSLAAIVKTAKNTQINIARSFYINRCEVRQGDYYRYQKWSDSHPTPSYKHPEEPDGHAYSSSSETHKILYKPDNPATGVSFFNAYAYCKASGGRLPDAEEWSVAAGGNDDRLYPWGNDFTYAAWKNPEPIYNVAVSCGQFPDTDTPDGISDMGNGVSEWTEQGGDGGNFFLSGGNAFQKPYEIYAMRLTKQPTDPLTRDEYAGFRCVYDAPIRHTPWKTDMNPVSVQSGLYPAEIPKNSISPLFVDNVYEKNPERLRQMFQKLRYPPTFRFRKNEVTVWEFLFFLYDPLTSIGIYDHPDKPAGQDYTPLEWDLQLLKPFTAVRGVDWWTAYAFAVRAGGRLPKEEEWNRVYTNDFTTKYPWGNEIFKGMSVDRFWKTYASAPSNKNIDDSTVSGIAHLSGNVSEWTGSYIFVNETHEMVVKGGNYLLPLKATASFLFRRTLNPNIKDRSTGIRLIVAD